MCCVSVCVSAMCVCDIAYLVAPASFMLSVSVSIKSVSIKSLVVIFLTVGFPVFTPWPSGSENSTSSAERMVVVVVVLLCAAAPAIVVAVAVEVVVATVLVCM